MVLLPSTASIASRKARSSISWNGCTTSTSLLSHGWPASLVASLLMWLWMRAEWMAALSVEKTLSMFLVSNDGSKIHKVSEAGTHG